MLSRGKISLTFALCSVALMGTGFSSWVIGVDELPAATEGNIVITTDIYTISFINSTVFSCSPSGYVIDESDEVSETAIYSVTLNIETNIDTTNLIVYPTITDTTSYINNVPTSFLFTELNGLNYSYSSSTNSATITQSSNKKTATSTCTLNNVNAKNNPISLTLNYVFKYNSDSHASIYDNLPTTGASLTISASMEVK